MSITSLLGTIFGGIFLGIATIFPTLFQRHPQIESGPEPVLEELSTEVTEVATTSAPEIREEPKPEPEPKKESNAPTETQKPIQKPVVEAPKPVETTPEPVPAEPEPTVSPSDANTLVRNALVNILCTTGGSGSLKPISGSGVIVDSRGVILTNAHVAQFFLLKDYPTKDNVTCVIRTGSPARSLYTAELLYISPSWVNANASKITEANPSGTGRYDFALLHITGRTDQTASLPSSFSRVKGLIGGIDVGTEVLLAGYPAGFLDGANIQTNLYPSSALTSIQDVFTFVSGGGIDLIAIGGTILSQKGASGGAVVQASDAALIGLITTATIDGSTATRDLRAITLKHINDTMLEETGQELDAYLTGDISLKARAFNLTTAPTLTRALTQILNK